MDMMTGGQMNDFQNFHQPELDKWSPILTHIDIIPMYEELTCLDISKAIISAIPVPAWIRRELLLNSEHASKTCRQYIVQVH